ncbi:F0F1 ATP synthase subunit A [Geofilum rubicundum]|uniref:F0F1 ATP synthase subunit A n=1 Tax=Geofilum rubicundum TaxID=472113 RepID=UPI000780DCF0|nr:F0F1 ATP synthase subunit A [Geofilum rubicundum]
MRALKNLVFLLLFFVPVLAFAAPEETKEDAPEFDVTGMIMHHIGDAYDFHIISFTNGRGEKVHVSLPLPVIIWHEGHLQIFMSSRFQGGAALVAAGDDYLKLYHEKVYLTDAEGTIYYDDAHQVLNPKPLNLSITKNVASMLLASLLLAMVFISVARVYAKRGGLSVPKGLQLAIEPVVLYIRDDIVGAQIDKDKVNKFLPFLLTVFFFIWFNNMLGLIPFFPGGANMSGNISFTLTLAVFTFFATNLFGSRHYWKEILWPPGAPVYVKLFLIPIEFIGMFTKPFALMLRLFANITAGHIIVLSLTSIIFVLQSIYVAPLSVLLSLMIFSLEFLVALLQAYIFTLLSALFIGLAVNEHH